MRTIALLLGFLGLPVLAAAQGWQDPWLDHLTGDWVMQGTIASKPATHDVHAEWVLGHYYVQIHEVSRDRDAQGRPSYEATVFIGWDETSKDHACLWLDSTGGGGLVGSAIAHGKRDGNKLPFLFHDPDGSLFHNTFEYDAAAGTWSWRLDNEAQGKLKPFARLTLTRK